MAVLKSELESAREEILPRADGVAERVVNFFPNPVSLFDIGYPVVVIKAAASLIYRRRCPTFFKLLLKEDISALTDTQNAKSSPTALPGCRMGVLRKDRDNKEGLGMIPGPSGGGQRKPAFSFISTNLNEETQ